MKNFTNLYAVKKVIVFEFKPSKNTHKRISLTEGGNSKIKDLESGIHVSDLFDEKKPDSKKYFKSQYEVFNALFDCFIHINEKILRGEYENYKIYVDTEKIKSLGKDFKDCYFEMKKKKKIKYKGIDYETKEEKTKICSFSHTLTIHQLLSNQIFKEVFGKKIANLKTKWKFNKIELGKFLEKDNKYITKSDGLYGLRSFINCIEEACSFIDIFYDQGMKGSSGCDSFINDLKSFKEKIKDDNIEVISRQVVMQINEVINSKTFSYKFTLNFKAKNPSIKFFGETEEILQKELKDEIGKLEANKRKRSNIETIISLLKLPNKELRKIKKSELITKWSSHINKQNIPEDFIEIEIRNTIEEEKEECNKRIRSNYSKINQIKAAIHNSQISHYGVIINKQNYFYLALENKLLNGKQKKDSEYVLNALQNSNSSCKLLDYQSLTWKAIEKLALFPTSSINRKNEKTIKQWEEERRSNFANVGTDFIQSIKEYLQDIIQKNNLSLLFSEVHFSQCNTLEEIKLYFDDKCYKNQWIDGDWEELLRLDEEGKINLYQIYNKDFEIDENFATSDSDKEKIQRIKKAKEVLGDDFSSGKNKKNLFSIYWNNYFKELTSNHRLQAEGKVYVRKKSLIHTSKRYQEDKIFGDFLIIFNSTSRTVNQSSMDGEERINNYNKYFIGKYKKDEVYVVGLDRGENSLVSYALVKFKKKKIEEGDIKVKFSDSVGDLGWVLDDIIEAQDLSAVKVYNKNGGWKKSEFVNQKKDCYFIKQNNEDEYLQDLNKKGAEEKKAEIEKQHPDWKVIILPIRDNHNVEKGAYAVKILSWKEEDGSVYNYRVAQEQLKEERLQQKENNHLFELLETEKFKQGFASALTNYIAEKSQKYGALIALENLNNSKHKNQEKTFGASVYQVIENKLVSKLSYLVIKESKDSHLQLTPEIRKIEEIKGKLEIKDYCLGFMLIIDENNTSKVCPLCGYSKKDKESITINNDEIQLSIKDSSDIDKSKKQGFKIKEDTRTHRYSPDGIITIQYTKDDEDFLNVISDTRQNVTKSEDFIRCVYCGYDSRCPENNHNNLKKISGGDILAAYNVAKRGLLLYSKSREVI